MNGNIPDHFVDTLCKPGNRVLTCAYLTMGGDGWFCGKADQSLIVTIKKRLADTGASRMGARGNNCSGPPDFHPIVGEQL